MSRLIRAAIGTNNIDNCSRVCHSPTSFALRRSLGLSGATGSFSDIDAADAAILIGANPTEGHPVVGARIKQATLRGLRLVTIDPRRIELADYGVLHLSPRPGTNAAVMLGLCHVVLRDGLTDPAFIAARTEGFEELEAAARALLAGSRRGDQRRPRRRSRGGRPHLRRGRERLDLLGPRRDRAQVRLRGRAADLQPRADDRASSARAGSALLPLRGQNNVQGSSDMGALPDTYTAYRPVADEAVAQLFEEAWGVPLSREKGYTMPQMFDAAVDGRLKAMWIFGEDVAQTDPNTAHVVKALETLEFLVCQDIFETETTKYADVILPASAFLEKSGTFINAERRFQLVAPALDPPGSAKTDFEIITLDLAGARARDGLGDAVRRDGRDRRADPRVRGRQPRAHRPPRPAVAGRPRRDRLADPLRSTSSACRAGARASPPCPTRSRATAPTASSR